MIVHRVQCAAITRGCLSALVWEDEREALDERRLLINGWHVSPKGALSEEWSGPGRWVCGLHPIEEAK